MLPCLLPGFHCRRAGFRQHFQAERAPLLHLFFCRPRQQASRATVAILIWLACCRRHSFPARKHRQRESPKTTAARERETKSHAASEADTARQRKSQCFLASITDRQTQRYRSRGLHSRLAFLHRSKVQAVRGTLQLHSILAFLHQ